MKRVVILEDNQVIQQILSSWFTDDDFEVLTMSETEGLKEQLATFDPDLILTDIMLPDASGHDMIELFETVHYPVIVISSMDRDDVDFFAGRIGAIAAFCKPIDLKEMFGFIHDYFSITNMNESYLMR